LASRFLLTVRALLTTQKHAAKDIAQASSDYVKTDQQTGPSGARVWFAFALVYVFWGSTYLAISVAIRSIPPALMCATRFLISGPLMLAWCAVTGHPVRIRRDEAWRLAVIGVLLLSGGNAMVAWSEQFTPTGMSALIVASVPIWVMVLEAVIRIFSGSWERLSARGMLGLVAGIGGTLLLLWPRLTANDAVGRRELIGAAGLMFASVSWALGSIFSHRWSKPTANEAEARSAINDPFSASAWEMIFAGVFNLLLAIAFRQPQRAHWTAQGLGAIIYLVIFGSWVGYTAYIWLLKHVPTPKVSTYAYVNPVVAVFLGWMILGERVDTYILAGSAIIVASVALVTTASMKREGRVHAAEGALGTADLPTCEPSAD